MEMEMRATEDIAMAQDLTPPLPPLSFSLHDTFISSHCSSCSQPLPLPTPPFSPIFPPNYSPLPSTPTLLYCSPFCASIDSPLHFSSAEHHFLQFFSPSTFHPDSACLRLSLRLLHLLQNENVLSLERIGGLVTNYRRVIQAQGDDEIWRMVKEGARDIGLATSMRDDGSDSNTLMAEAVMCLVMMNAVEVQEKSGLAVGVAVYDTSFSWINHSCSPNSCYRFSTGRQETAGQERFLISPATMGDSCGAESLNNTHKHQNSKSLVGTGPRIIVRSIKEIKKGEEVTIAYTDLLHPKAIRQSDLWLKYRFNCYCKRCSTIPATYVDYVLQESSVYNDEEIEQLKDWFDNAVAEYISFNNPESCCEMLENLLTRGHENESSDLKDQETPFNLLHHLSLDTYTTLASVYKVLACELSALDPQNSKLQVAGFSKSKASAAYSLLLAVLSHHLFLSECSLIAFVANCWGSAGESILSFARSSVWESSFRLGRVVSEASSFLNHESNNDHQLKRLIANLFCGQHPIMNFEDASKQLQNSIGDKITKTWSFLTHEGSSFLKQLNDLDLSSFLTMSTSTDSKGIPTIRNQEKERNGWVSELECSSKLRENLFQLGNYCLIYAAVLSSICYGQDSELVAKAVTLLNSESSSGSSSNG